MINDPGSPPEGEVTVGIGNISLRRRLIVWIEQTGWIQSVCVEAARMDLHRVKLKTPDVSVCVCVWECVCEGSVGRRTQIRGDEVRWDETLMIPEGTTVKSSKYFNCDTWRSDAFSRASGSQWKLSGKTNVSSRIQTHDVTEPACCVSTLSTSQQFIKDCHIVTSSLLYRENNTQSKSLWSLVCLKRKQSNKCKSISTCVYVLFSSTL